jgi:hypothetical protein
MAQEANISNDVHRILVKMGNPPNCLIVRVKQFALRSFAHLIPEGHRIG